MHKRPGIRARVSQPAFLVVAGVSAAAVALLVAVALAYQGVSVRITSPADGASVAGNVPVAVTYSVDNGHVHELVLYAGGIEADSVDMHDRSGSHTFHLDTSDYPDGPLTIRVAAYSSDRHSGHFSFDDITVNTDNSPPDSEKPVITIEEPADGALVGASPSRSPPRFPTMSAWRPVRW